MATEVHDPIWFSLVMSFIGNLPATLTALAALVYAIKNAGKLDVMNTKVDGIVSQSITAVKDMAKSEPRASRKTDP